MGKSKILLLFGMIILAGCSTPVPTNVPQTAELATATKLEQLAETPLPVVSATSAQPVNTSTPAITSSPTPEPFTPTATIPVEARLEFQSLDMLSSLPTDVKISGKFVLVAPYRNYDWQIYVWDMDSGDRQTLVPEGMGAGNVMISPNREWLAYTQGEGELGEVESPYTLVVVAANGHERLEIPHQDGWGALSQWLDNEHLIIRRTSLISALDSSFTAQFVLNPFTGELFELPQDPTDLLVDYPIPDWQGLGMISYDPTLTRRVYPNEQYELVLENLQTHEILSHFLATVWDSIPRWSPDGAMFVITNDENIGNGQMDFELYSVTYDGQIDKLTNLAAHYSETFIYSYSWSPDGQKIAFWLSTNSENPSHYNLAVLDMVTREVTLYADIDTSYGRPPIIWSPDGHQLLIGVTSPDSERSILVDLDENWAAPVTDGMIPVGWMISLKE